MPLSDFGFNSSAAPQEQLIFNGFGSAKRKFSWDTQSMQEDFDTENGCPAKRLCSDTNEQTANIFRTMQPVQPDSMQCLQPSIVSHPHAQVDTSSVYGCLKDAATPVHHTNSYQGQQEPAVQFASHPSETDMVMDLNDETYSSAAHDVDLDSGWTNMDSDYVPNPQQYRSDSLSSYAGQPSTDNIVYCSTPCGGGERSPSTNMVRCFCRPGMDTFLNIGPYVSDYY